MFGFIVACHFNMTKFYATNFFVSAIRFKTMLRNALKISCPVVTFRTFPAMYPLTVRIDCLESFAIASISPSCICPRYSLKASSKRVFAFCNFGVSFIVLSCILFVVLMHLYCLSIVKILTFSELQNLFLIKIEKWT